MPPIFHPSTNTIAKVTVLGAVVIVAALFGIVGVVVRSPYLTGVNVIDPQPVQFSHKHHVTDDGLDCRYCHQSVEVSAFAGMPSTEVCMNCHTYIWKDAPVLEPVRQSYQTGKPISWTRVTDLPDFVYFNHSIHVNRGVGCSSCHGPVDQMPLTWKAEPMTMEWCLKCHRDPARYLRPRDQVFNMDWQPAADQEQTGQRLIKDYGVNVAQLTDCYLCHR